MADLGVQPHVIEAVPTLLGAQLNVPAVHHVCTLSNRSRKRQRGALKVSYTARFKHWQVEQSPIRSCVINANFGRSR
jgi:hypothetical protein